MKLEVLYRNSMSEQDCASISTDTQTATLRISCGPLVIATASCGPSGGAVQVVIDRSQVVAGDAPHSIQRTPHEFLLGSLATALGVPAATLSQLAASEIRILSLLLLKPSNGMSSGTLALQSSGLFRSVSSGAVEECLRRAAATLASEGYPDLLICDAEGLFSLKKAG